MSLTGTLSNYGKEKSTWVNKFREKTKESLEKDENIINISSTEPVQETIEILEEKIEKDESLGIIEEGFYKTIELLDKTIQPGPKIPPFQDPLYAVDIGIFIDFLSSLNIPDPEQWIFENIEGLINIPESAIKEFSECKNEEMAIELNKIDENISTTEAEEKLKNICGFSFDSPEIDLSPNISFPDLSFDFALSEIDLPSLDPYINLNLPYPGINWLPIYIVFGIVDAIASLVTRIKELILKLVENISEFVTEIKNIIIDAVLKSISFFIELYSQATLFKAELNAFIELIAASFVPLFTGFIIHKGPISFVAGKVAGV
jgi:hypothetical protein